jgi:hypothetical protein
METLTIDLINPKAKKLLKDLMDLKLINIREIKPKSKLKELLRKISSEEEILMTMDEISDEVKAYRLEKHAK